MRRRSRFFLIAFFLPNLASASLDCSKWVPSTFSHIYNEENGIIPDSPFDLQTKERAQNNLDCSHVEIIGNHLKSVDAMLEGHLLPSEPLILNIKTQSGSPSVFGNIFDIPLKLKFESAIPFASFVPDSNLKALWTHEYAHAVFERNFLEEVPGYRVVTENTKLTASFLIKRTYVLYEIADLKKKLKEATDAELIAALKAEILGKNKIIDELFEDLNRVSLPEGEMARYNGILPYYHEFFADLVAVVFMRKGDIVYQSLVVAGASPESSRCRDFTSESNQLDEWVVNDEPHCALAPSRFAIWQKYLSRPEFQKNPGVFLKSVFAIISAQLKNYHQLIIEEKLDVWDTQFILQMNRDLIKSFSKL